MESDDGEAAPRSILVLDADPRSRALVEEILTAARYRVTSTGDPKSAVRMGRDDGADLLLADMGLGVMEAVPRWERRKTDPDPKTRAPVAEGYAVLRALSADSRAARYPTVFLREKAGDADRGQAYRFGVVDYIPKPIAPRLLLERVEDVFLELEPPSPSSEESLGRSDASADLVLPPSLLRPTSGSPHSPWPEDGPTSGEGLSAPAIEALPKGLRTALVVDGDPEARLFLRGLLAPFEFSVYEAADGEEGLSVALAKRPWLIFTEVNMPGIDGFELCRRVRNHAMTRHTPLIFFSGWDDYRERHLGMKLGADDYLSKGSSAREMLIRIQLILKRYSDVGTRTRKGSGLEGGIELIGAPGMLQMCHLGRFSGVCTVRSGNQRCTIRLRDGEIVSAESGRDRGADAVYRFLAWTEGHFEFVPGEVEGDALPQAFDYLLLEGCRRLDEVRRSPDDDTDPGLPAEAEERRSG